MQPIPHPETILLVHQTVIREELRRRHPQYHLYPSKVERGEGILSKVRRFIASALIAAGNRLAPAGHPDTALAGHASK